LERNRDLYVKKKTHLCFFLFAVSPFPQYSLPEGGLQAGDVFGYNVQFPNDRGTWETTGTFDISASAPDSMLVYCLNADAQPHFLSAVTTNGAFSAPGAASYAPGETAVPEQLADDGQLVLPFQPHYLYTGPRDGNRDELVASFEDPANFAGRDTPYEIVTSGGVVMKTTTVVSVILSAVVAVAAMWVV